MQSGPGLARRLGAWRAAKKLTLQQVGDTIGVSRQAISLIECGENDLGVSKLEVVCAKAFKIDLLTFFGPLPDRAAA